LNLILLLNNTLQVPFVNQREFNLDFSFNDFSPNVNILADFSPEFYGTGDTQDAYNYITNWIVKYGMAQNMPVSLIDLDSGFTLQRASLDFGNSSSQFNTQEGKIKPVLAPDNNSFFEIAESLDLRDFYANSDFVKTRYVREKVPDYLEAAILFLAIYVTTVQAVQIVKNTIEQIREAIPRSTTDAGLALNIALIILANALYLAAILVALYQLLKDLSEAIFGKPRAYYAVDVYDVLKKGCERLGFQFESKLLEGLTGLTYLASTTKSGVLRGTPENNPLPPVSLLEFFRIIGEGFNAKLKVNLNGLVQFEQKRTFEQNISGLQLQDIWNKGEFHFNSDLLNQAITIEYANAFTDGNYADNRIAVMFLTESLKQNLTQTIPPEFSDSYRDLIITAESKRVLTNLKNKININLRYAKAEVKTNEKPLEKTFNSIFDIVTGINKDAKLDVGERKGLLLLETDRVPVDLIYFRDEQKINIKTINFFTAENTFKTYYTDETPYENQYVTYTNRSAEPVFNEDTVMEIVNNNRALDASGREITITKNIKNKLTDLHEFEYKKKLRQGDFGFIEDQNFDVIVVGNSTPKREQYTWKNFWNDFIN
jgi:hypothetical protein